MVKKKLNPFGYILKLKYARWRAFAGNSTYKSIINIMTHYVVILFYESCDSFR